MGNEEMTFYKSAFACGFFFASFVGCTNVGDCVAIDDKKLQAELEEIVRPEIEFVRTSDGFVYKMSDHLKRNMLDFFECRGVYLAVSTPIPEIDGEIVSGLKTTYAINVGTGEIIGIKDE